MLNPPRYCVITAMRNCAPLLPAYVRMIEGFDPQPVRIVIGVNDCNDDTRQILERWGHPALELFHFETGQAAHARKADAERSAHLARVRNRVIEEALRSVDWDFALMQDAAKIGSPDMPRRLIADGGDIVAPYSVYWEEPGRFYDTWCFRDLKGKKFFARARPVEARMELISVGGVYMVKRRVFEAGCRLAGTDGRHCDSVPLCVQARQKGFRVFMRNDMQVTAYDFPDTVPRDPPPHSLLLAGDYVAPGLEVIDLDHAFPQLRVGKPGVPGERSLRDPLSQNWYYDLRFRDQPFLSRDEAHILYNTALRFRGKRALLLCDWVGWSAAHLIAGGPRLDVVSPSLARTEVSDLVVDGIKRMTGSPPVRLVPRDPLQALSETARKSGAPWDLVVLDTEPGNGTAEALARACEGHLSHSATILFHDAYHADVKAALAWLELSGWKTATYETMQQMAIAWRGDARPLRHRPPDRQLGS